MEPRRLAEKRPEPLAHDLFGIWIQRIEARIEGGNLYREIDSWQISLDALVDLRHASPTFGHRRQGLQQIQVAPLHRQRLFVAYRRLADDIQCECRRFGSQTLENRLQNLRFLVGDKTPRQPGNVLLHQGSE